MRKITILVFILVALLSSFFIATMLLLCELNTLESRIASVEYEREAWNRVVELLVDGIEINESVLEDLEHIEFSNFGWSNTSIPTITWDEVYYNLTHTFKRYGIWVPSKGYVKTRWFITNSLCHQVYREELSTCTEFMPEELLNLIDLKEMPYELLNNTDFTKRIFCSKDSSEMINYCINCSRGWIHVFYGTYNLSSSIIINKPIAFYGARSVNENRTIFNISEKIDSAIKILTYDRVTIQGFTVRVLNELEDSE